MRMNYNTFSTLHEMVTNSISKHNTQLRQSISSELQLAINLRFLASGDSYVSLEYLTRVSASTISIFVPKVCEALYGKLQPKYMRMPNITEEWEEIAEDFEKKWHFPHVIGALDGKHVQIQAPPNQGSYFYNYKGTHRVVLFALANAHYNFIYVDVGCNGRISDGGVFKASSLYTALQNNTLKIPKDKHLPFRETPVPYVMIGDDAFSLSPYLLKPFPRRQALTAKEKVFNYRLCRARRVVENTFGILTSRFRLFKKPICLKLAYIDKVILCACALHNFLNETTAQGNYEVSLLETMTNVACLGSNHSSMMSKSVREEFADCFYNEGQVDFQWKYI